MISFIPRSHGTRAGAPGWILPLALLACSLGFHAWYGADGLAMFDTGILASDADRLLRGDVFGRDFMAPYGPVRYYLTALVFDLFGPSLLVLAWLLILLRVGLDLLTYRLARFLLPPGAALLPTALVMVAHGSLHKSFLALAALSVLLPLLGHVVRMRRATAALAGAGVGVAFLVRYDVGVFGVAAFGVVLLLQRVHQAWLRRELGGHLVAAGLGAAGVVGPVAVVLLAAGLRPGWWWEMSWQRIAIQEAIVRPFPWPWVALREGHLSAALTGSYLLLSPIVLAGGGFVCWSWCRRAERRLQGIALAPVVVLAVLLLNQARLVPTFNHFLQGAMPLFIVGAVGLRRALVGLRGRGERAAGWAGALYLSPLMVMILHVTFGTHGTHPGSFTVRERANVILAGERGGIRVPPYQAREVTSVIEFIRKHSRAGETIVCPHSAPVLNFLADRPAALPFSEPSYYYRNDEVQKRLVERLRDQPARLFIYDPSPVVGYTMDRDAGVLLAALRSSMRPVGSVGRFLIYAR